ncbi:MAG: hypothetical protein IJV04_03745, partial [Lachnospiraceae bacterium]|nr:hypothetical protein [Lachnospiraceae bacterium]
HLPGWITGESGRCRQPDCRLCGGFHLPVWVTEDSVKHRRRVRKNGERPWDGLFPLPAWFPEWFGKRMTQDGRQ